MNKGMCTPLDDKSFFVLLTDNGTKFVNEIVKFYPELKIFIKQWE